MKKNIIASLLKFAEYVHNHKILPGYIFGLILKNKMGRDLKFAGYVPHYKILTRNIFHLILKKQDGRHWRFFVSHEMCLYLPYNWSLEVWDGKPTDRKSWAGNLLVWVRFDLRPLLQGQMKIAIAKLKSAYNSLNNWS